MFNEKRRIIENCLFGVDLNPNSVNICRLRLWIELLKNAYYTKESGYKQLQTLPNIDINIKVGDSLLSKYPVQNGHVVLDFLQKEDKAGKKNGLAAKLKEYRKNVQDYKAGGTSYNKQQLRLNIAGLKSQLKEPPSIDLFGNVVKNNDIDFSNSLEWMFEFPEILDDEGRFTGFDAIIGNPPYVQLQSMGEMSDVYSKRDYSCYNKSADLYCLFVERAYSLLKKNGYFSFIMPNKWMLVDYGKELREFMSQTSLKKILNFGDVQFFADATIYVCIFVSQKSGDKLPVLACSLNSKNYHGEFEKEVKAATFEFPAENFGASEWSIRNKFHDAVLQKMNVGTALKDMPISIYRGILTGFNDAFFIDGKTREKLITEDPKSEELIKPLLRGRDINAWVTENDQYLINPHNGIKEKNIAPINIDEYPAIKKHLDQFIDKLIKRGDKGDTPYNLRNCAYLEEFAKPKIMYPNMTSVFPFTYDETGSFSNDKSFIITEKDNSQNLPKGTENIIASEAKQSNAETTSDVIPAKAGISSPSGYDLLKALLAIFNSNLVKLWIWYNCPELMGGTREIRKAYFENLRIPLNNTELLQQLATLADEIICLKKELVNSNKTQVPEPAEGPTEATQKQLATFETQVNTLVYQLYGISDTEEIEAVEKR